MKNKITLILSFIPALVFAQQAAFIKLVEPTGETSNFTSPRQFLIGSTCKGCKLSVNDQAVKVYASGGFAFEINLGKADTMIRIMASGTDEKRITKNIRYVYVKPKTVEPVRSLEIVSIETFPEGNLLLQTGDKIKIKAKGLTGCMALLNNHLRMYEMPGKDSVSKGIYQTEYTVSALDSFSLEKFKVTLTNKKGETLTRETKNNFSVLTGPSIAITKGRLSFLEYGLGEDRLGGAKIGYLDSLVLLNITGKFGNKYRVGLTKTLSAYVPDDLVSFAPAGTFTPASLTGNMRAYGNEKNDFVTLELLQRLPYQSILQVNPGRILVDVFGATNNTNWVTHLESMKEIKNVSYEQKEDDVFRITIELKHQNQWGYKIYYSGTNLVIKINRQPENLSLSNLRIAIDAGHGGSNQGARGPTGVYEKELTLAIALKLQKLLQVEKATVMMTRITDGEYENKQRILFYRDSVPDLLVSIHLNSAGDPIRAGGTSTYYKYAGFKPLSNFIYKRMLETGLSERGNVGNFNFMLNSPTEYPNALVETLFISNPEEEDKALNEDFQQLMADKILAGIKDFLKSCDTNEQKIRSATNKRSRQ